MKGFIMYIIIMVGVIFAMFAGFAVGDAIGHQRGYEDGFNSCIEENNLYDRYEEYFRMRY